jgi:hypothetical protein
MRLRSHLAILSYFSNAFTLSPNPHSSILNIDFPHEITIM